MKLALGEGLYLLRHHNVLRGGTAADVDAGELAQRLPTASSGKAATYGAPPASETTSGRLATAKRARSRLACRYDLFGDVMGAAPAGIMLSDPSASASIAIMPAIG